MSKILDDVLETAKDLHEAGMITDEQYAEFLALRDEHINDTKKGEEK